METFLGPKTPTPKTRFCNFLKKYLAPKKGPGPFDPVAIKYYELEDETTCIEQPTIAALQCIKNHLLTRSGSIDMDQPL